MTEAPGSAADARDLWVGAERSAVRPGQTSRSPFVPILLVVLALTTALAFQAVQLLRERQQIEQTRAALEPQEQAAAKLRASLDQVATATAKLATEGNPNARMIVEQLRSRGVTINSPPASAPR
jgi:hypothetical protein